MKTKETALTLNGVRFTPEMLDLLERWYLDILNKEDMVPCIMIENLEDTQRFIIEVSEEMSKDDEEAMGILRKLMFVIDNIKPFKEGGAA